MTDIQGVYEMVTKQKPPAPGALERQHKRQVRTARNRKFGAIAAVAAIAVMAVTLLLVNRPGGDGTTLVPAAEQSSRTAAPEQATPMGTVTFDGSTCSLELRADPLEPGYVVFEVVNATERPAQFDSWLIREGYTFGSFEAVLERGLRRLEAGKEGVFPEVGQEILYLDNEPVAAGGSGIASFVLAPGEEYAMTCLQRVEGQGIFSWGPAGPIAVG